jgi:hypothetical protein
VSLNVGRFRCESAPACTFNTDFHNALAIHQRYCKHGAAAPHAAAAEGEAGDDEGDDSDDSRDERAAPVPAAKKQRGSWAVFTTSVLPRAPQAGRTTALRAAPPEIIALGGAEQRRRL